MQFDFSSIDTANTDGVELATLLENWRDALNSLHSGSSEPAYAAPGMLWVDTSTSKPVLKMKGTSASVSIGELDFTGNIFKPFVGASLAGALAIKDVISTADIQDEAITSIKMGPNSVLRASLGTDIIDETHIDAAAAGAIRLLLGLGSAALLDASAFGALAYLNTLVAGSINSEAAANGDVLIADGAGGAAFVALNAQNSGNLIGVEIFTASGTWNKPAGCNSVKVSVTGAGGGGSGIRTSSFGGNNGADGGLSSFGSECSATGGEGGDAFQPSVVDVDTPLGGIGVNGDINLRGQSGHHPSFFRTPNSSNDSVYSNTGAPGGASFMGGGGRASAENTNASDADGYGGGGGAPSRDAGGSVNNAGGQSGAGAGTAIKYLFDFSSSSEVVTIGNGGAGGNDNYDGGNGGPGIVIIEEYT